MNFSELPNPFDFANPVKDSDLFAGRTNEMDEIKYYLNQACKASRPINLAILGDRASGKTSVLNMIEIEAKRREIFVARIDLDEGDVRTELAFFYKIFDSILTTACLQGAYEGIKGKTYDTYRDMVDAYEIPEDKTFCSFVFPIQYAKTMASGNIGAPLSETNFRNDLTKIREQQKLPIILIFDECDVLVKSRVHLEKLRNIFMNTPGFMLAITGSPSLFPLMDEVFSPIIRQFKKIHLEPFKELEETKACIRKPLESIGITDPTVVFDFEERPDINEIHDLAGGHPYEIQLLCHVMFRRVQEGRANRMKLTLDVLDDLRMELESFHDVASRPVLAAIRSLDRKGLSALRILCACNDYATFEQLWFTEFIYHGEKRWTEERLLEQLNLFQEKQIITIKNDVISFRGDDFDRVYIKYLSRKHGVPLSIRDFPFEIFLGFRLDLFLNNSFIDLISLELLSFGEIEELGIRDVAMALKEDSVEENPFESMPDEAEQAYWSMIDLQKLDSFQVAGITIISPWMSVRQWYRWKNPKAAKKTAMEKIIPLVEEVNNRAKLFDGGLNVEIYDIPVIPIELLAKKVESSQNTKIKRRLAAEHSIKMAEAYLEQHSVKEAVFHGELGYLYNPVPEIANNLGYVFMASNNLPRAKELLEKAVEEYENPEEQALPIYNLGIIEAKEGQFGRAIEKFELSVKKIEGQERKKRTMACLILPKKVDTKLVFEEVKNPDLIETAKYAISTVNQMNNL